LEIRARDHCLRQVGQSIRPSNPAAAMTVEGSGMAVMVKVLPVLAMLLPA
jgi:hypothetical protein